ncbi:MAG TPA: cobaltochelatase subunit CobN [Microscillaceae bacterium]|nr:cobaltochelatase subunit CobN [Microscillaceae bacterium]
MHLIASIPGGWNPDDDGVFHIEQSPGDIIYLSAADTELLSLHKVWTNLHQNPQVFAQQDGSVVQALPSLRLANLLYFKQELTIDTYLEEVVPQARLVVLRLLGGKAYFQYLIEAFQAVCEDHNIPLLFLPGYDTPDLELMHCSTVPLEVVHQTWQYLAAGGNDNLDNCLKYLLNSFFALKTSIAPVASVPDLFISEEYCPNRNPAQDQVVILVYRTHYLADNLAPIHMLAKQLQAHQLEPIVVFAHTLRDDHVSDDLYNLLEQNKAHNIACVINTTSFSIKPMGQEAQANFIFERWQVPVIQAMMASATRESWQEGLFGLSPTDIAMNIALPEVDGRIITQPISFKKQLEKDALTEADLVMYEPYVEGCQWVADLAYRYVSLHRKSNEEKKIALILPNYPNKDSRLANGVGLDTPASAAAVLNKLQAAGYTLEETIHWDSGLLMECLTQHITNDLDTVDYRRYEVYLEKADFEAYYATIPRELRKAIEQQWGNPYDDPYFVNNRFVFAGFIIGNVFVSIQPSRGYHVDPQATYHSPDLSPPWYYLAYYCWVQRHFKADALIHLGKHGNLEWLPGKSVALNPESCFPAHIFNALPHFYPFIVNDPGEGTQAKRRNQAVIIDHLIPPMTRAETYGDLLELENLIDEYYQAANLDPKRAKLLRQQIVKLTQKAQLNIDLGVATDDIDALLVMLDGYLCEIKEAQIRDGLHILGQAPENEQLVDLLVALHRIPQSGNLGITQALAKDLQLALDPIHTDYTALVDKEALTFSDSILLAFKDLNIQLPDTPRHVGEVVAFLESIAKTYLTQKLQHKLTLPLGIWPQFEQVIHQIATNTLLKVHAAQEELDNLLVGLQGRYVPSGPSGAPTRGRLDILPTGRNFYSVDIRTVPTEAAYTLGQKSAQLLIERYMQENGDYPRHIALSVWGTATMRTGGDDLAQALALMGVRPVWQRASRRVRDFEIIPLAKLGRPRVDVTLRISGFFRDAFPDMISLFNAVVEKLAHLNESPEDNPIRANFLKEQQAWMAQGMPEEVANEKALYRVFGSKPGAYGAGLQTLIDEKSWETRDDLAQVYIQWSAYAYTKKGGKSAHEAFVNRLKNVEIVLQNQDNREHDLLDSDDYYQFQGGLSNAVTSVKGTAPEIYFGDHARPENPKMKSLKEELLKVYRSRVVNPKWIAGVKRHGYKGAFEMAATMDYLFAYDATTDLIEDFMYEGITEAYLLDDATRDFIQEVNPWALQDMSERMLEAIQRGMWKSPLPATKEALEQIYLQADDVLEEKSGTTSKL